MPVLLDELRRRRVFRTVAAYVVGCWVVIEAADVIFPYLSVPESAVRVVIYAAFIGFPVVLLLAWFFDITPAGIVLTPERTETTAPAPRLLGRWTDLVLLGLLAIAVAYIIQQRLDEPATRDAAGMRSIAVLPFADLSAAGDSAYLGDGIAEELLHTLARMEGLRVAARTSSFAFRGGATSIRQIGSTLDVDTVLEGSIRKDERNNRVRVTAQLIDASDGFHLWSETYEGPLDDVFRIQDQIASAIAEKLRLTLLGQTAPGADEAPGSVEAYELYLKGRSAAHRRTESALLEAQAAFERATEIDPDYALAYTGFADSLSLLIDYGNARLTDIAPRVERLVDRALELSPDLPEAFASLGLLRLQQQRFPEAEQALSRALALDPTNDQALMWYGTVLLAQDRYRDALATYLRAYERDPLSIPLNVNLGNLLDTMGRHRQAESHYRKLLDLKPDDIGIYHNGLMQSAHARGDMTESARWAYLELERDPYNLSALFQLVRVCVDLGLAEEAGDWLSAMQELDEQDFLTAQAYSLWFLATGRYGENLDYVRQRLDRLEQSLESYGVGLPPGVLAWLGSAHFFAGDYESARFAYEQALEFDGGISAPSINANNQIWLPWLIRVYAILGESGKSGTLADAMSAYIDRELAAGIDTASIHGQRAQLMQLRGDSAEAVRELSAATERGFRQTYYLETAPDMASTLASAEGQALLAEIESYRAADRTRYDQLARPAYSPPPQPEALDLPGEIRDRYAGRYRLETGNIVTIEDASRGLTLRLPGMAPRELRATSSTEFRVEGSALRLEFVLDEREILRHVLWRQYGGEMRARPYSSPREIGAFEIDPMILADYEGRYAVEGVAGLSVQVDRKDDTLYASVTGQSSIPYRPVDEDTFGNELLGVTLRFRRDRTGAVTQIVLEQEGRVLRGTRAD